MVDPRVEKLARVLVSYSTRVGAGEKVLIEAEETPTEVVLELMRQVAEAGGLPFVVVRSQHVMRALLMMATEEHMKVHADFELYRAKMMNVYIGLLSRSMSEYSDVPTEKMRLYYQHWVQPVHFEHIVPHTKWVITRYPTPWLAEKARMSVEGFQDFYFRVCALDYANMSRAMDPLKALMERTEEVRIWAPQTDLRFSISGIPVIKADGKYNIPDGEVFTAPVRDSITGHITFNTPTVYQGKTFENIRLDFLEGKIVKATCPTNATELNKILDSDEGARYTGEFSLGLNPYITFPMRDILFDEKIAGSIHLTPGNAYREADNGNRSQIHWDMVMIQTPEYGGGEIWFDGTLIRKDGHFVPTELQPLNPENLKIPMT